jgi:hypothetical protein
MNIIRGWLFVVAIALIGLPLQAQLPPPAWVRMQKIDVSAEIPYVLQAPAGFRLRRLAELPAGQRPLSITSASNGITYVLLEDAGRRPDGQAPKGRIVAIRVAAENRAGGKPPSFEMFRDDLPDPGALVADGDWLIVRSGPRLVRMQPFDSDRLTSLEADAAARRGPPTTATPDKKWIEQELLAGLASPQSGDGLLLGIDAWLYLAAGPLVKPLESWDAARVDPTGSSVILRLRPDGSGLDEYARGLAQPRGVESDAVGNLFALDQVPADEGEKGEKHETRLVQVLAGGDYGWRSDLPRQQFEWPGTLPTLGNLPITAPSPLAVGRNPHLPKHLAGLVLVPSIAEHAVRAWKVDRSGATFAIAQEFSLLASDNQRFQPAAIAEQLDGSLLVATSPAADEPTSQGTLYQLAWIGTDDMPLAAREDAEKSALPADRQEQLALAGRATEPAPLRAKALLAASESWDQTAHDTCVALIAGEDVEMARLAAELLADHLPADKPVQESLAAILQDRLLSAPPAVQRSLFLTLGKLGQKLDTVPEWIFEATSVTRELQSDRIVFDGHIRAAEMPAGAGTELMLGNLEVALIDPNVDPAERFRLKQFVAATAAGMRTRELASFVERLIKDEADFFSKLDSSVQMRILAAYRNLHLTPPLKADIVANWLATHPQAASEVQLAAAQALARLGTANPEPLVKLAKLVAAIPNGERDPQLAPLLEQALQPHAVASQRGEVDAALQSLRGK